jgi:hypothetical protein
MKITIDIPDEYLVQPWAKDEAGLTQFALISTVDSLIEDQSDRMKQAFMESVGDRSESNVIDALKKRVADLEARAQRK